MTTADTQEVYTRLDKIDRQLHRLTLALMGDAALGHQGIVPRLEKIEGLAAEAPSLHHIIEERYKDGDKRVHQRVDELVSEWDRFKYLAIGLAAGVSVAGGFGGTWLFNVIMGG